VARDAAQSLVDAVDRLLPQTQCTRCGYAGCRPYAEAVVLEHAPINRCPPGGQAGVERLAHLLERPAQPLDAACGVEAPRRVARIVADLCIGCTKCIQACPVDAIAGAPGQLHGVIPELCTGCDLCLPPCPADCIEMVEPAPVRAAWAPADADAARERFRRRGLRLQRLQRQHDERLAAVATPGLQAPASEAQDAATSRKRLVVEAAMARARARLEAHR
jgi:Na+-translocating ferredoxin:NAD+ oxidoreductase subunit B